MTEIDIQMYLVGGAVRDFMLGVATKDLDYTVVVGGINGGSIPFNADSAFDLMRLHLIEQGFKIFLETPQFFTIRARFPVDKTLPYDSRTGMTADFVLARREGPYSDNRHPDWVVAGTLEDDLSRRDFSVNAMALDFNNNLIDLFEGQRDLERRLLRAVGDPKDRLMEDPLRAYRAIRFAITKGFRIDGALKDAINTVAILDRMSEVSVERIREELHRAFAYDTVGTILLLVQDYPALLPILKQTGIWLKPTLEKP